jgi:aminoglycoside phosphotransferase (APT) family kinase protein
MGKHEVVAFGRTAEILAYTPRKVLKLFKADLPEDLIEAEYRIGKEVYALGVPCPEPSEILAYGERRGIVYDRLDGITMFRSIYLQPLTLEDNARKFASLHLDLHRRSAKNLPEQKERLADRIEEAPLLTRTEKDAILKHLASLPGGNKLCHGDYHPDNILLGQQAEWVIDWMTGTQGNPAGDVARTHLLLKLGRLPEETPQDVKQGISRIRIQLLDTYLREYMDGSEVSMKDVNDWLPPYAAARLCEWIPEEEKRDLLKIIRAKLRTQ